MATTDNETFKQLLEQIKVLNQNLETTSFAINNLTIQLSSKELGAVTVNSILPPTGSNTQAKSDASANSKQATFLDTSNGAGGQAFRAIGYINWDSSHDVLETQNLVKMTLIRDAFRKIQMTDTTATATQTQQAITQYGQQTQTRPKTYSGHFTFHAQNSPKVNKEMRFPQDAVYVDVNSPLVKHEIDFMNKINVQPTDGVMERFMGIVENEMHTCASFEKKYGLKWV